MRVLTEARDDDGSGDSGSCELPSVGARNLINSLGFLVLYTHKNSPQLLLVFWYISKICNKNILVIGKWED